MKINKVQTIPQQRNRIKSSAQVSFGAKPPTKPATYAEEFLKLDNKLTKFFTYVGEHEGEMLNTAVTFGGTAVVAPLFIAFNPLSKESKENKVYTAGRQPISAVIAAAFQFYINSKFNNWLYKTASTGGWGPLYDISAEPSEAYLKRLIALEKPNLKGAELLEEIENRKVTTRRTAIAQARIEFGQLKERILKDGTIKKEMPHIKTSQMIHQDQLGKDYYEAVMNDLRTQYADQIAGMSEKKANKFLKKKVSSIALKRKAIESVKKDVEIEARAKWVIRKFADNSKKNGQSMEDILKMLNEKATVVQNERTKCFYEKLITKLTKIHEYESANNLKDFSSVKDLGKSKKAVLRNVKIKKMVRANIANNKVRVGNAKNAYGIILSLVTLPFSCGLLNWAYPRVMEKVMPVLMPWIHKNDAVEPEKVAMAPAGTEIEIDDVDDIDDDIELDELEEEDDA